MASGNGNGDGQERALCVRTREGTEQYDNKHRLIYDVRVVVITR